MAPIVPAPGNFDIAVQRQGSALVVAPVGEIDMATVGLVRDAVERDHDGQAPVVLDLRGVEFMDTSGLRYVLELSEQAAEQGFGLRLVRGGTTVQRVFEVSGVEGRLPFVDDPSHAPPDGD
jgi:anti-sigma B factor antagonist